MRPMDETCASELTVRPAPFSGAWASFLRLIRSRRNRTKVARLENLSDHELYDIGLTRSNLRLTLHESRFFEDPSAGLVHRQHCRVY